MTLDCTLLDEVPGNDEELTEDNIELLKLLMTVLLCVEPPVDDGEIVTDDEGPRDDEVEDCRLSVLTEEDTRFVDDDVTIEGDDETPVELDVVAELDANTALLNTDDEPLWDEEVLPTELDDPAAGACTH
ncbi:hypothetical protein SLS60_002961 [Paraconiothyrium brasiliense]|uniref:Uncharacterized protein n=1 Tax=Paraconiothyrium brasiliense TaxID=300254 RepID=A0ABR3RVN8_9PLEO